jgi:hypothetical protein
LTPRCGAGIGSGERRKNRFTSNGDGLRAVPVFVGAAPPVFLAAARADVLKTIPLSEIKAHARKLH